MTGAGKSPEHYQIEDFVADETFINYVLGTREEDKLFWENWINGHPTQVNLAADAKELLHNLTLTLSAKEFEQELARITRAINEGKVGKVSNETKVYRLPYPDKPIAAVARKKIHLLRFLLPILILLIAGTVYYTIQYYRKPGLITKTNSGDKPVVFGLSDGTIITLSANSMIRYPAEFGKNIREVHLEGEAFFQVARDEAHPFKVYTGELIATVLGTVFSIKNIAGEPAVQIELIKGRLKVETVPNAGLPPQSVILNPDERVIYAGHGQKLSKEKWQSQIDLLPPTNHLLFRKNNFGEIAAKLKTVFGVTLVNQSSRRDWRFTGEFTNTSMLHVIESICIVEKLNYEVKGDTVFIK